jgi:hypothetical protein
MTLRVVAIMQPAVISLNLSELNAATIGAAGCPRYESPPTAPSTRLPVTPIRLLSRHETAGALIRLSPG